MKRFEKDLALHIPEQGLWSNQHMKQSLFLFVCQFVCFLFFVPPTRFLLQTSPMQAIGQGGFFSIPKVYCETDTGRSKQLTVYDRFRYALSLFARGKTCNLFLFMSVCLVKRSSFNFSDVMEFCCILVCLIFCFTYFVIFIFQQRSD